MYYIGVLNIIAFIVAFALFIDQHYVQKKEGSAFIGYLFILVMVLGLVLSGGAVYQGR